MLKMGNETDTFIISLDSREQRGTSLLQVSADGNLSLERFVSVSEDSFIELSHGATDGEKTDFGWSLSEPLPIGLRFTERKLDNNLHLDLSGTPIEQKQTTTYTITGTRGTDTRNTSFDVVVSAGTIPSGAANAYFEDVDVDNVYEFFVGDEIRIPVPRAVNLAGTTDSVFYELRGSGLFRIETNENDSNYVVFSSGKADRAITARLTYEAYLNDYPRDDNRATAVRSEDISTIEFTVVINPKPTSYGLDYGVSGIEVNAYTQDVLNFGPKTTIPNFNLTIGDKVNFLFPFAFGGRTPGQILYEWNKSIPSGLTADSTNRVWEGVVDAEYSPQEMQWIARRGDDMYSLRFTVQVSDVTELTFGDQTIDDVVANPGNFASDRIVFPRPFVPRALQAQSGTIVYTLSGSPGLTFNPSSVTLAGLIAMSQVGYDEDLTFRASYQVSGTEVDSAELTFNFSVVAP